MIMLRTVIIVVAVCYAGSSMAEETNAPDTSAQEYSVNVTAVTARLLQEYVTPTICMYSQDFCDKHQLQSSRGIQSYLATAGTMFAGVLGVILMKIKILVVLSLMTTVIGKMLLFYAFLKSDHYHHGHHHHGHHHGHHHHGHGHHHGHHHHVPFVKYTRDKYYIKNSPAEHHHDVVVEPPAHHAPYHAHSDDLHRTSASESASSGVSYYKR